MQKITRLFSVVLFLFFLFPISCDDGCGGFETRLFTISQLDLNVGTYFSDGSISGASSNSYLTATLNVTVSDVEIARSNAELPSFSFINAVYACSPPPDNYMSELSAIGVTSNDTLITESRTYLPGVDLGGLFYVRADYEFIDGDFPTIAQFINFQNSDTYIFGRDGSSFNLLLREFVEIENQQITVRVELQNGREFLMPTDEFVIRN